MDDMVSSEQLARLWDRYTQACRQYRSAKQATDAAEAACQAAYDECEAAYADEVRCALDVGETSRAFQAATDAAFLAEIGISVR